MTAASPHVRLATEADVPAIHAIFEAVYKGDYPYPGFFDDDWLKHSVFSDHILMLVAVDEQENVLGTASVVFDIGAHSDLLGEFGRLAVHPDARGRGVGKLLMRKRLEYVRSRLHVAVVENRTAHSLSQRISLGQGFAPVGFHPLSNLFHRRESIALFTQHFGSALSLRCNHPHIVPEAAALAAMAMGNCGLTFDAIVDEQSAPYPHDDDFQLHDLTADGLPTLLRIERGRLHRREIFGPMRLHYGFFMLSRRHATYLLACRPTESDCPPVAGAIGYIHDAAEKAVRIFELIAPTNEPVRFLLEHLLHKCRNEWDVDYVTVDVSAHAPRMQRTLLELGLLPVAYVPAMVFHDVERLDVVRMARLLVPLDLGTVELIPPMRAIADVVLRAFRRQAVVPALSRTLNSLRLFAGLNEEQAERVAGACAVVRYRAGETLFAAGDAPDALHLVIEGRVRVDVGTPPRAVGEVGAGESLGEVALLTGEQHSAGATAVEDSLLAALTRADLADLIRLRPDVGVVLYRNLAEGLGRKLQRLDEALVHGALAGTTAADGTLAEEPGSDG